jgi:hypothetical protein
MQLEQEVFCSELAVPKPEISEVMDMETGQYVNLQAVTGRDRDRLMQRRMEIKEAQLRGEPLYVCSECHVPVSLLMHPDSRRFYFKHTHEDGRCSAVTRGVLSHEEINARKYNGAKESRLHARMKDLVRKSLAADHCFSQQQIEKRWMGELNGRWRQPDVQAVYDLAGTNDKVRIAFEVQLSTTYLDVIAGRRQFYAGERGLLFWIFSEFNENGRRLTQDDVFFNNNQNAFIVNQETADVSEASGQFHLMCLWAHPETFTLQRKLVSFHELRFDLVRQRVYYFDYSAAKAEIEKENRSREMQSLRNRVESYWITYGHNVVGNPDEWKAIREGYAAFDVMLPEFPSHLPTHLIDMLYSAKHGRPVGWDYQTLVQVAHWVVAQYKSHLEIFRIALGVYCRANQLVKEDKTGNWRRKVDIYKAAIARGDTDFAPDTQNDSIVLVLFPELFDLSGRRLPIGSGRGNR